MSRTTSPDDRTAPIRAAIRSSIDDINASDIPVEDRQTVLRAVLTVRLGGAVAAPTASADAAPHGAGPSAAPADGSDLLSRIAAGMKLDRDTIELIYAEKEGEPEVVLSAKKLPDLKAAATKVLAQLVVGARQAAGLEEWTPVNTVRPVVQNYGRLDTSNFSTHMLQLDRVCLAKGKGLQRELKVTKPGMEEIAALVQALAGN